MIKQLIKPFTSLRLTVTLLALGVVLIFWGTVAQVESGLYKVQDRFFQSFFVYWQPQGANWRLPIFPGGYLIGGLLLINLFAAHLRYYKPEKRKIGIALLHLGVVLLLLGQLFTDVLSVESYMHIREGTASNYSEAHRKFELAVIDTNDAELAKVVAIPDTRLKPGDDIAHTEMPFTLRIKNYFINSEIVSASADGFEPIGATVGFGTNSWWRPRPHETAMDRRDMPAGLIEVVGPKGPVGTFLASVWLTKPVSFSYEGRDYELSLRLERYYKPFSLHLIDFRFDRYPGTEKAKNFSSRVRIDRADTGESREVDIYMNNPLRYDGETFFQADWDKDDERGTVLQVVRNPSWLTPYFACIIVAVGMTWQFLGHLFKSAAKRKAA